MLESGLAEKEANEQEDTHGDGVGEEGLVPGLLHTNNITEKQYHTTTVFENFRAHLSISVSLYNNFFMYSERSRVKGVSLHFYCSKVQEKYIRSCAKKSGMPLSVYLREIAVQGLRTRDSPLPPAMLAFQGEVCQVAGLLEVIARKRLDEEDLNALERAQLKELSKTLMNMSHELKKQFL